MNDLAQEQKKFFKLAQEAKLQEPVFDFSREFTIIIWRSNTNTPQVPHKHPTSTPQAPHKYPTSEEIKQLVKAFSGEMKRSEIQKIIGLSDRKSFIENYLQPAIEDDFVELTIPDKPNSPKQKYRLTPKGIELQKQLKQV